MFTIVITFPGGRTATKKLKGKDETSKEVERVTQQLITDHGTLSGYSFGGSVKAFYPDGSSFMAMEF